MMGYMEIAGYLAILNNLLTESLREKDDETLRKIVEAVRQAELIMFRHAADIIAEAVEEKSNVN